MDGTEETRMSITVATRVWRHSPQRGTMKLLLLAFAEFANDDGICWPSVTRLASYINETERNTRLLIRRLVNEGELVTIPGGGRGNTTRYGIATGLTERQLSRLNSDLRNTVTRNTETPKKGVENFTETEKNSEILCIETVKSGAGDEAPNSAVESAETALSVGGIRNRTVIESREEREGVHSPAVSLYFEFYPGETLDANQIGEINRRITDLKRWRKALSYWTANRHRARSIGKICDRYDEEAIGPPGRNGHRPTEARPPPQPVAPTIPADAHTTDETARRLVAMRKQQRE